MSFSSEVKKELLAVEAKSRHCQLAELSAMLSGSGEVSVQNGQVQVSFVTENQQAVARYAKLLGQAGGITVEPTQAGSTYRVDLREEGAVKKLLRLLKQMDSNGTLKTMVFTDGLLLQKKLLQAGVPSGRVFGGGINQQSEKIVPF